MRDPPASPTKFFSLEWPSNTRSASVVVADRPHSRSVESVEAETSSLGPQKRTYDTAFLQGRAWGEAGKLWEVQGWVAVTVLELQ